MRTTLLAVIGTFLIFSTLSAQQAILTPVKDNTLYQTADGSTSNGAGAHLFVGRVNASGGGAIRRALIKFDIAGSIPAGATVTSVQLQLNMSKTTNGAQTVSVKRVTADWGEGTSDAGANEGSGAASTTGDATWIHRFKATSNWTSAGGDASGTISASLSVDAAQVYTWTSTPQLVADVQNWLTAPSNNFGWLLVGNESASGTSKRFDSRETPTAGDRPQLTVNYTTSTSVTDAQASPSEFRLIGNYPNPFNPETRIDYRVSENGEQVALLVFNLFGQEIARLVNARQSVGQHSATWHAQGMPSGIYFAVLEAGGMREVKRMILAK